MSAQTTRRDAAGFSLLEVTFALGILCVAALGMAGVLNAGMQSVSTSPADVVVTQKAAEAIEAVFAARDSQKLQWSQIRNVQGASGADGGIFVDAETPLTLAGNDGLVGTLDDPSTVESHLNVALSGYTRQITIRDVPNENGRLREISVTIKYVGNGQPRSYTLTSFISTYA